MLSYLKSLKPVLFMILIDVLLTILAVISALLLRFEGHVPAELLVPLQYWIILVVVFNVIFLSFFKLFGRLWKYASLGELLTITKATLCSLIVIMIVNFLFDLPELPFSFYILCWLLNTIYYSVFRLGSRLYPQLFPSLGSHGTHVLIVGAGDAGARLAREIKSNPVLGMSAVAFVDDDLQKIGKIMMGIPIKGTRQDIPRLVNMLNIEEIIIAMPSVKGQALREIIKICKTTSAKVKILPNLIQCEPIPIISQLRQVRMEDLLGRQPVEMDLRRICGYLRNKTVMVTGAGGSIGSELCRQILVFQPRQLILLDYSENNLFDIEMELRDAGWGDKLNVQLRDVKNRQELEYVFSTYRPQVIFHAAAYKHVPMMERHPEAALNNNVVGTKNTADIADQYGAETFILISTDKAVNPTSVMGACKRVAELYLEDLNSNSATKFAAVRFGNVLGSRGSVIPTFEKQIERGGPVTVTHPDMKRFFMTIPEAVELVLQAASLALGGEIFVLDMGVLVKIDDLARDLIRLHGFEPDKDIAITYTGIRPGEKLYEELFFGWEELSATHHERIMISSRESDMKNVAVNKKILKLIENVGTDREMIIKLISSIIPEYKISDKTANSPELLQDKVQ